MMMLLMMVMLLVVYFFVPEQYPLTSKESQRCAIRKSVFCILLCTIHYLLWYGEATSRFLHS